MPKAKTKVKAKKKTKKVQSIFDAQHLQDHAEKYFKEIGKNQTRNEGYVEAIHAATFDERFPQMYKVLPEKVFGSAEIRHFEVSVGQSSMTRLRAVLNPDTRWHEYIAPGKYASLTIDGTLFMTDTGHERWSSFPLLDNAYGTVFVSGLGLGMILLPLLLNGHVRKVYVLENTVDVVRLVASPLFRYLVRQVGMDRQRDVEILYGDVWEWDNPNKLRFNTIFHDIWSSFGPDLLPEFEKLKKRYRKWLPKESYATKWQGCWAEGTCKQLQLEQAEKEQEMEDLIALETADLERKFG
jgi:hypothetical protein